MRLILIMMVCFVVDGCSGYNRNDKRIQIGEKFRLKNIDGAICEVGVIKENNIFVIQFTPLDDMFPTGFQSEKLPCRVKDVTVSANAMTVWWDVSETVSGKDFGIGCELAKVYILNSKGYPVEIDKVVRNNGIE